MRGIAGHAMNGTYKAEGLASMASLIHGDSPFSFTVDKERTIFVPVELNKRLIQELFMIARELEGS